MAGKHLKKLRAEKSKVHLKKKILPKGQNITETKFTAKKILTVEQLKKVDENEPVSNWNVPLKDLLIRLNHYNVTSRLNGLSGIKEILSKHPEMLMGPSLNSLVSRLLALITDEEPKVRLTTVDLLKYLFELIPLASVAPFSDILNVYLGCAMTHRSVKVQKDSLKLIDIMIKYSPETIKHNFKSIARNFIRIIKNQLFDPQVNMLITSGSDLTLKKKKTEVLLQFYRFLLVGCPGNMSEKVPDCRSINLNILAKQNISLRDLTDQYKKIPDLSLLFRSSENKDENLNEFDSSEFQSLCSILIPMLFDTWVEYFPNQIPSECLLSEEMGELLSVLLKILLVLYLKIGTLNNAEMVFWFETNYGSKFQKLFTSHFPYLSAISMNKSESVSKFLRPYDFIVQNLIICYLSYSFKVVPKNSSTETKMENYLSDVLKLNNLTEIEVLSKVIEVVINASISKNSSTILSNVVVAYNSTKNLELQQSLSKVLANVILKESECVCLNNNSVMNWVKSLPHLLCKPEIFRQDIETILKLIIMPIGVDILREVECSVEEIVRNLPNIKIHGIHQLEGQKMIANILYKCSNEAMEKVIKSKILDSILYPSVLRNYIKNIFSQKLKY